MKPTIVALALLAAAAGCSKNDSMDNNTPGADKPSITAKEADNTGRNERDLHGDKPTPGMQGENDADLAITQQIRQQVVKTDDLSTDGKNVKIITIDGVVTLRGPVKDAAERSVIDSAAKHVDGVKRVDNQLEIAAK